jgi:hypothetical protein
MTNKILNLSQNGTAAIGRYRGQAVTEGRKATTSFVRNSPLRLVSPNEVRHRPRRPLSVQRVLRQHPEVIDAAFIAATAGAVALICCIGLSV